MRDGLYRVTTRKLCAGFVVEGGRVALCAPRLRRRLAYWQTVAVPVRNETPAECDTASDSPSSEG